MFKPDSNSCGEFYLKETGRWFTFSKNSNSWGKSHGFEYEIDVLDGKRCATIKKTVAYIVVDEDACGNPVVEKWNISKLSHYTR